MVEVIHIAVFDGNHVGHLIAVVRVMVGLHDGSVLAQSVEILAVAVGLGGAQPDVLGCANACESQYRQSDK